MQRVLISFTIVISDNGCRADAVVPASVIVNPNPVADFAVSNSDVSIFNPVVDFTNLSQLAVAGSWNFGDSQISNELNPQHTFPDTGTYEITLIVRSDKMCYDTLRKMIHVRDEFAIYFPNAFTPNNDGINEMFKPFGVGVSSFEMTVFDRWGMEIFVTDNIEKGWDGNFRGDGRQCQGDTYVYLAHAIDSGGRNHEFVGKINLVR
ncbi:MAG: gliding motility-associated C-terminal domain-containing protein [Bacteroidetes bacterium]|nr:gliding motility-associated C-terminal domain-containing protein [Bacteroidota bacterium]